MNLETCQMALSADMDSRINYFKIARGNLNNTKVWEELVKHKLITQYEKSCIDEIAISTKKER